MSLRHFLLIMLMAAPSVSWAASEQFGIIRFRGVIVEAPPEIRLYSEQNDNTNGVSYNILNSKKDLQAVVTQIKADPKVNQVRQHEIKKQLYVIEITMN